MDIADRTAASDSDDADEDDCERRGGLSKP